MRENIFHGGNMTTLPISASAEDFLELCKNVPGILIKNNAQKTFADYYDNEALHIYLMKEELRKINAKITIQYEPDSGVVKILHERKDDDKVKSIAKKHGLIWRKGINLPTLSTENE